MSKIKKKKHKHYKKWNRSEIISLLGLIVQIIAMLVSFFKK